MPRPSTFVCAWRPATRRPPTRPCEGCSEADAGWLITAPLPPERLLLARLLLATHQPAEALAAAAVFDHQIPAAFLPFVPASLRVREQAALALGRRAEARLYRERLAALGHTVPTPVAFQSPTTEAP